MPVCVHLFAFLAVEKHAAHVVEALPEIQVRVAHPPDKSHPAKPRSPAAHAPDLRFFVTTHCSPPQPKYIGYAGKGAAIGGIHQLEAGIEPLGANGSAT